ncbi:MAG TPA: DUF4253 domain-containing protein [Vicinamibacteria bacterium]|nr:DUF4253 domain-containing protein [Vicinamibacteria bacterium]
MKLSPKVILAIAIGALCGCGATDVVLTNEDLSLRAETGIEETFLLEMKQAGRNLRQLEGVDSEGNATKVRGVTIDVPHDRSLTVVSSLARLAPPEVVVFVSERHFGMGEEPDRVSAMKTSDPFESLRAMGTNGWNYDISPEMIIARLRQWDAIFGLSLRGVAFDWVEAEFETHPRDMLAFAREVYEFCPDVVDQGTETVEALADEMRRSNVLYLWWD